MNVGSGAGGQVRAEVRPKKSYASLRRRMEIGKPLIHPVHRIHVIEREIIAILHDQLLGLAIVSGAGLLVADARPKGNQLVHLGIVVPMVSQKDVNKTVGQESFPFIVSPAIQAEGKWQDSRTFRASLLAPLDMGTAYVAVVREGLQSLKGKKIGSGTFRFQTDSLSVNGVRTVRERNGRAALVFDFNTPGREIGRASRRERV